MGRRALPKTDSSIDFSQHLKEVDELPDPWDADKLFDSAFDSPAPLEIEVGSGKGLFMQRAAEATPGHNFLGIEIGRKYAQFSATRLAKHKLPNAIMVAGDGLRIFRELLPAKSVVAVHVYFPDPWWKRCHRKRRVMTEQFVQDIERVLTPDGVFHFWTDVKEYFDESLELIARCSSLTGPLEVPETPAEYDLDYHTHFERRMRLRDEPVYRSAYRS